MDGLRGEKEGEVEGVACEEEAGVRSAGVLRREMGASRQTRVKELTEDHDDPLFDRLPMGRPWFLFLLIVLDHSGEQIPRPLQHHVGSRS